MLPMRRLLLLTTFILSISSISSFAQISGEITYLPTEKYFDTTLSEIQNAKVSITVYMYLTSASRFRTGSRPYQLVDALIKAHDNGIKVKVVFDENIDFQKEGNLTEKNLRRTKNIQAYEILKQHSVPVFFDSPSNYTHSKVVIIDDETTILGSANWSITALSRNIESNVLIKSKEFAEEVKSSLQERVQLQNTRLISPESVYLPWSFMDDPKLLGTMVSDSDEKAFFMYLQLLKEYSGNKEAEVHIPYETWLEKKEPARIYQEGITTEEYRRATNRILKKLEDKYGLIAFIPKRGEDATVVLKDPSNKEQLYKIPKEKYISIPRTYWIYNWDKTLPFKGSVFYILNFGYSNLSNTPPNWFYSLKDLADKHSISEWFLSEGIQDLREHNLIEVFYDEIPTSADNERLANRYSPNIPYNQKRLKNHFDALESEYGTDKLQRAKKLLAIVHENSDANAAEALIKLEEKYGLEVVQRGKAAIEDKKSDNPKKSISYLIGTIEKIGKMTEVAGSVNEN